MYLGMSVEVDLNLKLTRLVGAVGPVEHDLGPVHLPMTNSDAYHGI